MANDNDPIIDTYRYIMNGGRQREMTAEEIRVQEEARRLYQQSAERHPFNYGDAEREIRNRNPFAQAQDITETPEGARMRQRYIQDITRQNQTVRWTEPLPQPAPPPTTYEEWVAANNYPIETAGLADFSDVDHMGSGGKAPSESPPAKEPEPLDPEFGNHFM